LKFKKAFYVSDSNFTLAAEHARVRSYVRNISKFSMTVSKF
jgi:hypothetical protein